MNMKELAIAFGERIGDHVPANQLKRKGGWLFHKLPDYPDEVDCYALPLSYIAEPFDCIPVEDSPFIIKRAHTSKSNLERVEKAIAKLTKSYDEYIKEIS